MSDLQLTELTEKKNLFFIFFSVITFSLSLILTACQSSSFINADPAQSSAYYHFIKANYALLENEPKIALSEMEAAVIADPAAYYHGLNMAQWILKAEVDKAPLILKYLEKTTAVYPDEPLALLLSGHVYSTLTDYQSAEVKYREVLDLNPNEPEALFSLGRLVAANNQYDEAEKYFHRLISLEPNSGVGYYYLGQLALKQKKINEAIRWLFLAHKNNPDFLKATVDLAQCYEELGQFKKAELLYRQAIKKNVELNFLQIRLAKLLLKSGHKKESSQILLKLPEINGNQTKLLLQLGIIYLEQNQQILAAEEFRNVLNQEPHNQQASYLLASALIDMNQYSEAHKLLADIPTYDDNYINARLFLATSLSDLKRYDEAIGVIKEASHNMPAEEKFIAAWAYLYEMKGEPTEALKKLAEGVNRFSNDANMHFRYAILLDKSGQAKKAQKEFQNTLELDENHAEALNYLAYSWAEKKENLTQALEFARKALSLKPDNGYIMDTVAWIYYTMEEPQKALPLLKQAINYADDFIIWEHLGDVYLKLNQPQKAKNAYLKAKSKDHEDMEKINEKIKLLSNF